MGYIVGREAETEELLDLYHNGRAEFVAVYGRRRVGKTFLIDEFFHAKYDFSYVGGHNLCKHRSDIG